MKERGLRSKRWKVNGQKGHLALIRLKNRLELKIGGIVIGLG